jgi:phosphoglycerate dehydrogenase-like enzyme
MPYTLVLIREDDYADSHLADAFVPLLKAQVPEATVVLARTRAEQLENIANADAAWGRVDAELFARAKRLRWISSPQAGPNPSFYHDDLVKSGVVVTNVRGIFNDHISAHILSYVLAFSRGLHLYLARQAKHEYRPDAPTVYLPEATALVIGAGGIGGETIRLLNEFRMTVIAMDARIEHPPPGAKELLRPDALMQALPRADFVIVTAPETPATRGFMNAKAFAAMKKGAYFINIGRGATTKLDDLNAALRSGHLAGAGLDVYEIEPLPRDHPLWDAPGAILTPHTAAHGPYLDDRRTAVFLENAKRFAKGEALMNVVDKANWY